MTDKLGITSGEKILALEMLTEIGYVHRQRSSDNMSSVFHILGIWYGRAPVEKMAKKEKAV